MSFLIFFKLSLLRWLVQESTEAFALVRAGKQKSKFRTSTIQYQTRLFLLFWALLNRPCAWISTADSFQCLAGQWFLSCTTTEFKWWTKLNNKTFSCLDRQGHPQCYPKALRNDVLARMAKSKTMSEWQVISFGRFISLHRPKSEWVSE